jgi:hypothetical protein
MHWWCHRAPGELSTWDDSMYRIPKCVDSTGQDAVESTYLPVLKNNNRAHATFGGGD